VSLSDIILREMAGIAPISGGALSFLEEHYRLLLVWNQRMNLTRVTEVSEAALRHYCESLFLAAHLTAGRVADVGSGAGFPGIPAAVVRPDCQFDLIESNQRKAVFLREATRYLSNVRVLAKRAEDVADAYDWVVARAVDPDEVLRLRLASRFALLIGEEDARRISRATVSPLPWGERRVLAVVSHETD
jgi:16S rRNA G527 N7-methylase RsmG